MLHLLFADSYIVQLLLFCKMISKEMKKSGLLTHDDRKASQGYVDLKKKTLPELQELLHRQDAILNNKSFISKLQDKGCKIINFKSQIEEEIKRRDEIDAASQLLAGLQLNSSEPEDIEWNKGDVLTEDGQLDSDDDSDVDVDPLKLIATHSGTVHQSRRKKILPPEPSLITEKDLKEINEDSYAVHICEKFGQVSESKPRFKPNQNKSGRKDEISTENVKKNLGAKWEITEATPPVFVHPNTKRISLTESLQLQKEQAEKLKEIERRHAAERLMIHADVKMGNTLPKTNITEYRTVKDAFEDTTRHIHCSEDEFYEAEDDEDEKGGAVFYNLIDDTEGT